MNIVCRKTKCKHNNNQACMNRKINIDKELNCTQYQPIEKQSLQDISRNMMEIAPEIAPFRYTKDIDIRCNANCIFNKESVCNANGIFVNGQTSEANKKLENNAKSGEKRVKNRKNTQKNYKKSKIGEEKDVCKTSKNIFSERNVCMNFQKLESQCVSKNCFEEDDTKVDNEENFDCKVVKDGEAKCFTFVNR